MIEPDLPPPHDLDAERVTLGSMCLNVDDAQTVMGIVAVEDFYSPANRRLFECFTDLRRHGYTPTESAVRDWLRSHPDSAVVSPEALKDALFAGTVGFRRDAEVVAECSARRAVMRDAEETLRRAADPACSLGDAGESARHALEASALAPTSVEPGPGIDEWLAQASDEPDWLVRGFVERMERVLLTGWLEKGGKTVMLRQLAVQAAAGIKWFSSGVSCDPKRVLFVDAENPDGISRRWFRRLRDVAADMLDDESRLVVKLRPEGLDLVGGNDRRWLFGLCEANRPDFVFIGPLYKLGVLDPNDEQQVKELTMFFDLLRTRYDVCLFMEAHTPNESPGSRRQLRPIGSSVWRRWCDFGLGIELDDNDKTRWQLTQWASRDDRDWPIKLDRDNHPSQWPWKKRDLAEQEEF